MDCEQARMPPSGARHVREKDLLWSSTEGQAANAGVFLGAALTFWLIVPVAYAFYRYLRSATTRYTLTDQRLLIQTGIFVKHVETLELYRVLDLSVSSTLLLTVLGRGRIVASSTDTTAPTLTINAIASPQLVADQMREAVEICRVLKGTRTFDH